MVVLCPSCVVNFLPCARFRGQNFSPILMKFGQNVCFDKISDEFENGSCRVKNYVTRSNHRKTSMDHNLSTIHMNVCLGKKRSLGQILKKSCVCYKVHISDPILMKLGQNVRFDEISKKFVMGHVWSKTRSRGQII